MSKETQNKPLRVAINGFGRIGRAVVRHIIDRETTDLELVAINDHSDAKKMAEALELDTSYGTPAWDIKSKKNNLLIADKKIRTFVKDDPSLLPWDKLDIDVVVESTGAFTHARDARKHLKAGAQKVLISAYPSGGSAKVYVSGASDLSRIKGNVLSHASCTTTCVTPIMTVLEDKFVVESTSLLAVESVTHSSQTIDKTSGRGRRRRSAMVNIIPIDIEAENAVPQVVSSLKSRFVAQGVRVPTPVVHLAVLNVVFSQKVSARQLNKVFKDAADSDKYRGVIAVTDKPVVSQDLKQRSESAIIDLGMTSSVGRLAQIFAWYDNEWAFSARIVDLLERMAVQER